MTTATAPRAVPEGYMEDSAGRLVPVASVKPEHMLEDGLVRRLDELARGAAQQLLELRTTAFAEADAFIALLGEKYGAEKGGAKGNVTFTSYDGSLRVQLAVGDQLAFGPELQVAKNLIDGCLNAWSEGADPNLRTLVMDAFEVGKEGKLRMDRILALRRLSISDPAWLKAMEAISDAVRVVQSRRYVRFYRRASPGGGYVQVPLDLARV